MSNVKVQGDVDGTGTFTIAAPDSNNDRTLTLPDSTGTVATLGTSLTLATAVTASGTAVDFTGIPSWVKRITVMFDGLSSNGTNPFLLQIGDSGGIENSGYQSSSAVVGVSTTSALASTAGFIAFINSASFSLQGAYTLSKINGNAWVAAGNFSYPSANNFVVLAAGSKTLSDTLTQVRITAANNVDTFDAGTINIMYEG